MSKHRDENKLVKTFYWERVSPILPKRILDFHTHVWMADQWSSAGEAADTSDGLGQNDAAKYMVTQTQYSVSQLHDDLCGIFPDKQSRAVVFGQPTPAVDIDKTNEYVGKNAPVDDYPLLVCGGGSVDKQQIYERITQQNFYGYKVFLNWVGNDYKNVSIEDMLLPDEMDIANEFGLVVLLHVPRSLRLADRQIGASVRRLARDYPKAKIVLAHCGRCYDPYLMRAAIGQVSDLENVYMDTAMVMDPVSIAMAMKEIGSDRMLFATDLPVAAMRGKRVNIMDHWVDVVVDEYPQSDFRVQSNGIRASFMAHEIVIAIEQAADIAGLCEQQLRSIFYDNGMKLLRSVKKEPRW